MGIKPELKALEGRRVLCAVSGGADSMCLLHLLYASGLDVAAAHFEHGIRGAESLRDADFVSGWCAGQGIKCFLAHGDVPGYAHAQGLGTEEAARILRYEFLRATAAENGYELIATAHTADDNAETLIFNLCRGAGAAGLRGIPPERGNIVRPLLGCSRRDIERYLEENAVPHVEDSSNMSDDYSRNLIRHRVIPALRELNPELSSALTRTAGLMRRDEDCLSAQAEAFLAEGFDGESLPLVGLDRLHPAVASRVIRALTGATPSAEHVETVLRLCREGGPAMADLPGRRLRIERGRLWLSLETPVPLPCRRLTPGETLHIPELGMKVSANITEYGGEINDLFKTYYLKYESISSAVTISGRMPGDKLHPVGRGCAKSLKQLFAEADYSLARRSATPVIRDERGVLAVYGLAADQRTAAAAGDRVLRIDFENDIGENC